MKNNISHKFSTGFRFTDYGDVYFSKIKYIHIQDKISNNIWSPLKNQIEVYLRWSEIECSINNNTFETHEK
jgi:hypothetical protein